MTTNHTKCNQKQPEVNTFCNLTEKWKKGELEALDKLIKQIEVIDNNRALSDEYLESNGLCTREGCDVVSEWSYGIVWVMVDYVLPYLKQVQQLHKFLEEFNALDVAKENQKLKDLLYKCREKLDELDYGCEVWQGELTGFIEEIDNAIGEKK